MVDVVVAGAGPAGCAASIVLARAGLRVLLADPRIGLARRIKIGETLPAVALVALRDLQIGPELLRAAGARPATGIVSAWGSDEPRSADAIFDVHGHGWHLDRTRFDAALLAEARAAGAEVRAEKVRVRLSAGAAAAASTASASASASASAASADAAVPLRVGAADLRARWVVDATGRAASIARALGGRHARADRLVAVYTRIRTPREDVDARTRIEAVPDGWWYSAPVAARRRVVVFLTDADLLDPALRTRAGVAAALSATRHVLPAGGAPSLELAPAATVAHGTRLSPCRQPGWLAVGDAALAFDPLSSQGILNALVTGMLGAAAILEPTGHADGAYARRLADVWTAYEAHRADAYALERRWPAEPFWARRLVR